MSAVEGHCAGNSRVCNVLCFGTAAQVTVGHALLVVVWPLRR